MTLLGDALVLVVLHGECMAGRGLFGQAVSHGLVVWGGDSGGVVGDGEEVLVYGASRHFGERQAGGAAC